MDKKFVESLADIQIRLVATKGQWNNFGKYNYRSCEDIMEAVKPLLKEKNFILTVTDDIFSIGDRYYVKATATITDGENSISNTAYARESESKSGMDSAQITGATSSYARKYALNGLLCIDDNKDADSNEQAEEIKAKTQKQSAPKVEKKIALESKIETLPKELDEKFNKTKSYLKKQPSLSSEERDRLTLLIAEIEKHDKEKANEIKNLLSNLK